MNIYVIKCLILYNFVRFYLFKVEYNFDPTKTSNKFVLIGSQRKTVFKK